ncbi:MAG: HlyD family efflux transporter periplasmic adaptor subunit [Oscillospiraceae bacterium]|nr:HlyD family efflux transporter periplasmic adaptor subunit [Ruminococcus sp.]MDY6060331.1 HlyD family efflux transporter periplasmic adaptor subunit [Oscillospiraceae bacterium]
MKRKIPWFQITSVVLSIIVISYIVYNAFAYSYSPIDTQRLTEETTIEETIDFKGFALRDEKIIDTSASGTVIPLAHDGKRVANGDDIAVVCQNDDQAAAYTKLESLKHELERYKNINDPDGTQELSADKLNTKISDAYDDIMDAVTTGAYDELPDALTAYADKCATKQILTDGSIDLSAKLTSLENEIAALTAQNINYSSVKAPKSGYYINTIDGYESALSYKDALSLTSQQIESALNAEPAAVSGNSLGKIVESYKWYIVGETESQNSSYFKNGAKITVNFPKEGVNHVTMLVEKADTQGDKMTVVLSCSLMDETFANMRTEDMQIVTKSHTGYRVPSNVIRFDEDNNTGIYVLRGKIITFIPVEIIYTEDDFAIISSSSSNGKSVRLYDEVIIKGKDLEDGKVIN